MERLKMGRRKVVEVARSFRAVLTEERVTVRRDAGPHLRTQHGTVERTWDNFKEALRGRYAKLYLENTMGGYVSGFELPLVSSRQSEGSLDRITVEITPKGRQVIEDFLAGLPPDEAEAFEALKEKLDQAVPELATMSDSEIMELAYRTDAERDLTKTPES